MDEVNSKYKSIINKSLEKHSELIDKRRARIRNYISQTKDNFETKLASLRNRAKLEVAYINYKVMQINYYDIMHIIKIWVMSIMGEIRK